MDVENLKFDVIVNDKDFDKQVASIEKRAKDFNTDVSKSLEVEIKLKQGSISKFKNDLGDMKREAQNLANALRSSMNINLSTKQIISSKGVQNAQQMIPLLQRIAAEIRNMPQAPVIVDPAKLDALLDKLNTNLGPSSEAVRGMSQMVDLSSEFAKYTGIAIGGAGLKQFVSELVKVTGEFEVQKMALTSMLQDANKADKVFEQLKTNALQSPYTFQELAKYAKQLTAFNIASDQLVETEQRLADVAAGLGVDMGRIILAYGQVKSAGVLKGTELRQFTEAGVPLLEELAKQIQETEGHAISLSEVFQRISKKQIPFEMVEEAFKRMTSEGGKFYNMQEVLVNTLQGKINKLKDVWQQALYSIGSQSSGLLKGTVDKITDIVANIEKFGSLIESLVFGFGSYVAILGVCAAAQQLVFGVQTIANIGRVIKEIKALTETSAKLAAVSKLMNPVAFTLAALATAGYAAYRALTDVSAAQKRLDEATVKYNNTIDSELGKIGRLRAVLLDAKKGTEEWKAAKDEVVRSYGQYFDGLDQEITKVGNLETAYDKLIDKVTKSVSIRQFADFYTSEKSTYEGKEDKYLENLQKALINEKTGLGAFEGTLVFRNLNKQIEANRGKLANTIDSLLKQSLPSDVYTSMKAWTYKSLAENLDKAYNEFMSNWKLAAERMGFGDVLFDPETLLARIGGESGSSALSTWKPTSTGKTEAQKKVESDIKLLEKFLDAYRKLLPYVGENNIVSVLQSIFDPEGKNGYTFDNLEQRLSSLLDDLAKFGPDAERSAEQIRASLGIDKVSIAVKEYQSAEKALKKYTEALEKFLEVDTEVEGTGAAYKISKAISDYNTAFNRIENKFKDLSGDAIKSENPFNLWGSLVKIITQKNALQGKEMAKLKNAIAGAANDLFKEGLSGYDLTNFNDKTLSQLNEIKRVVGSIKVSDEVKKYLEKYPELLKLLNEEIERLKNEKIDNTLDPERWKKIAKNAKYIGQQFLKVADSLREFAEVTDNTNLSEAAEAVGAVAQNLQAAEQGAEAWGGWWGAIIGGATDLVTQVLGGITEVEKKAKELQETFRNTFRDTEIENFRNSLQHEGIFGENNYKEITDSVKALQGLEEQIKNMRGIVAGNNNWLNLFTTSGRYAVEFTKTKENFWHLADRMDIESIAAETGKDLLDDYKNFNVELLNWIKDAGWDLTDEEKQWLDDAIMISQNYADAMKVVEEAMSSLFDNVASDAADKIIDSWVDAGDAALDYVDILDDVARAYAKMLIQSTIMSTFLDPITEDLKSAFMEGRYDDAMYMIAGAMNGIAESAPLFEDILSAFEPYFNRSESSNSLGSGIQSITEETASLLASYINAMRADLSIMRGLQEKGFGTLELIGQAFPSLNDYLAQIAATNFDISQSNQSILSELRSVIGAPDSSGSIVRVQMA